MKKELKSIVKFDWDSYLRIKEMFESEDTGNHIVAFSILENIDMKINIVPVLLLIKLFKNTVSSDQWEKILKKVVKVTGKQDLSRITYDIIYRITKDKWPDDLYMMFNQCSLIQSKRLARWGLRFLEDCDLIIALKSK